MALVGLVGVRTAIALSIIPGLLAAAAIVYAIRHAPRAEQRQRQPLRLRIRPVLTGRLLADLAYGRGPGPVGYQLLTPSELSTAGG